LNVDAGAKGKGGCDSSRNHAGNLAQTAGGKMKGVIWDLVKDVNLPRKAARGPGLL
jgi:hypothetical protein